MRALPQLPSPTGTALVDARTLDVSPVEELKPPEPPLLAKLYPWLLMGSTGLAAIFCVLYLTKPVVVANPAISAPAAPAPLPQPSVAEVVQPKVLPAPPVVAKADPRVLPDPRLLPGDSVRPELTSPKVLPSGESKPFEETNLRMQHVLSAQGPAGEDLGRIVLDVPVLYRSRALRWTPKEITRARQLMAGISNYQERSRALREEGRQLLGEWNELIGASIPAETLRADSPTLPSNQDSDHNAEGAQDTIHSIQIDR